MATTTSLIIVVPKTEADPTSVIVIVPGNEGRALIVDDYLKIIGVAVTIAFSPIGY